MPKYSKPYAPNLIWASNALEGAVVQPDDEKIAQGWIQEKPPLENENWSVNRINQGFAYYNQLGIPEWDAETEYQAGKSFVQGSDGNVYRALVTNTGYNPAGSGRDRWQIAFLAHTAVSSFGRTLIDDTTAEQARQTLGLGSAANESSGGFLRTTNNLSDVANPSTAFNNIKQKATTERTGVVELATNDEVIDGVRDDVAVTPSSLGGMNPSGTVITFAGQVAPRGYLECDGRTLSRTEYSNLFSAIGTIYGNGDGSTTFRIPDLRGQFVRGWDNGRGVDNNRQIGSSQSGQIASHGHTGVTNSGGVHNHTGSTEGDGNHQHSYSYSRVRNGAGSGNGSLDDTSDDDYSLWFSYGGATNYGGYHAHNFSTDSNGSHEHNFTTNSTGGSETRPVNVALMYCIKV